ncbi:hypothetical protein D9M68_785820 [compost metagenome]
MFAQRICQGRRGRGLEASKLCHLASEISFHVQRLAGLLCGSLANPYIAALRLPCSRLAQRSCRFTLRRDRCAQLLDSRVLAVCRGLRRAHHSHLGDIESSGLKSE